VAGGDRLAGWTLAEVVNVATFGRLESVRAILPVRDGSTQGYALCPECALGVVSPENQAEYIAVHNWEEFEGSCDQCLCEL